MGFFVEMEVQSDRRYSIYCLPDQNIIKINWYYLILLYIDIAKHCQPRNGYYQRVAGLFQVFFCPTPKFPLMKNFFSLLIWLAVLPTAAVVQAGSGDQQKLHSRATAMTRQIAQKTALNEGQYVKVRQLNMRLLTEMQALQARYASDPAALDQQLAELQGRYEWDLATILWPRQMAAYTQSKTDLMAFSAR